MCQYKSEGGRRCPIHRHDSMAAVDLASRSTGLTSKQVADVFTELRREGRGMGRSLVPQQEWHAYLQSLHRQAHGARGTASENVAKALDASTPAPNRATFYALKNLQERSSARAQALQDEIRRIARENEQPVELIRASYNSALTEGSSRRRPSTAYTVSVVESAQERNLPSDPATVSALNSVQSSIERAEERRVRLIDLDESESRNFSRAGYDRSSGRLEVVFRHMDQDKIYAYRDVPEATWQEFSDRYSLIRMRMIQNNPHYQYDNEEQEAVAAHAPRCLQCGQFAGIYHDCPTASEASTSAAAHNPLDAPERIIPDAQHIAFPESFDYTPTALNQCHPSQGSFQKTMTQKVELSELGIGDSDGMVMMLQEDLAAQVTADKLPNLDPEQRREILDAPRSTQFILRNAYVFDPADAAVEMPIERSPIPRPESVTSIDIAATYNAHETASYNFDHGRRGAARSITVRSVKRPHESNDYTFTAEEASAREARVEADIDKAVESGQAVRLSAARSFAYRYLIDGSLTEQPAIRFPKSGEVKAALQGGKEAVVEVQLRIVDGNYSDVDDQGYRRPSRSLGRTGAVVSGIAGLSHNTTNDTVELNNSTTHLKCNCSDYREKYYCAHIDYTRRHLPNAGRQSLPQMSRHPLLTVALSKCPEVDVKSRADGGEYISINREKIHMRSSYYTDCFDGISIPDDISSLPENERIAEMIRRDPGLAVIASTTKMEDPKVFHAALKRADTEIPVAIRYQTGSGTDRVEGTVVYQKTNDPQNLTPVSHRLRCSCVDYQENYDCKHVRDAVNRGNLVAGRGVFEEEDESMFSFLVSGNNAEFDRNTTLFTHIFNNPEMTEDEARAQVEEDRLAAEEAEAERQARWQEEHRQSQIRFAENFASRLEEEKRYWDPEERERVERAVAEYGTYRNTLVEKWEDRDPGYENDPQSFYEDYQQASSARDFNYSYSGVLDGATDGPGARRFGVEMEFVLPDTMSSADRRQTLSLIAADLHEAGLTATPRQQGYHAGSDNGWDRWSFEEDSTVDGEIVSPLLKDDEESWRELEHVCEIVKRHGGSANKKVGSHVHVSTGSFGHSTAKHGELHRTVTQNEDLMYRLAANPSTRTHRGQQWCRPNVVDGEDDLLPEHVGGFRLFEAAHGHMLNMETSSQMKQDKSHVEFRMWDGTLDPGVIQRQVMLSVAMTDHAERSVIANGGSKKPSTAPKKRGQHKIQEERVLSEAGVSSHTPETLMKVNESAAALLDGLFRRSEDRKKILGLFARNNWQE